MSDSLSSRIPASAVVLGCWPLGGAARNLGTAMGWQEINDDDASQVVAAALQVGVRRFDTADAYGLGRSERRLGLALADIPRETVSISSKVGYLQPADGSELWTRDNIRRALDASLSRLGTDYLDTWYVHHNSLDPGQTEQLHEVLTKVRAEGLVRQIGIRGPHRFSPERGAAEQSDKRAQHSRMLHALAPDVVSLRCNLLSPAAGVNEVYEASREMGASVQVYKTLAQGLLTSSYSEGFPTFCDGDHRSKKPWFSPQAHTALMRLRSEVAAAVPEHTVMEVALAWVRRMCPDADIVIGTQTPAHVEEWMSASIPTLTPETVIALETAAIRYRSVMPNYLD